MIPMIGARKTEKEEDRHTTKETEKEKKEGENTRAATVIRHFFLRCRAKGRERSGVDVLSRLVSQGLAYVRQVNAAESLVLGVANLNGRFLAPPMIFRRA